MMGSRRGLWRGELAGGITAAMLTIPVSVGYGMLALSPLGDAYVGHGVQAGLWSAILVPLVGFLLGAQSTLMYAPRGVVTFAIGSIAVHNVLGAGLVDLTDMRGTLALVFLVVFLAGCFQALLGAFRLGSLIRYVPFPVMAGFQNAAAALIFFSQLPAMLGIGRIVAPHHVLAHLGEGRPLTLLVGLVTSLAMWFGPRWLRPVPPAITGLCAGTATYYALAGLGLGTGLGPVIGRLPTAVPAPSYLLDFLAVPRSLDRWDEAVTVVSAALSLAIIASLDALLCAKTVESVTGRRPRGNQELLRLGAGNAVAAGFGAIASGINLASSFAAFRAGGRTGRSGLVSALGVLAAVLLLAPAIGLIPRVVVAGMLTVVSIQLFDRWSVQLARRMAAGQLVYWKSMTVDLLVVAVVAVVAVAVNLVAAVGIGIAVTVVSFLTRMSRSVIRRAVHGDTLHSRKTRDPRHMEALATVGRQILVLELDGALFFGTAEALARHVEQATREHVTCVILDLRRVNEMDSTGAGILRQLQGDLGRQGRQLLLSHVPATGRLASAYHDLGVVSAVTPGKIFPDTDRALEWAEDRLLAGVDPTDAQELPLEQMHVCRGMSPGERETLAAAVEHRVYARGQAVVQQGDRSRDLYLIARGSASVTVHLPGQDRDNRLATFSAGTVFGEMALLDDEPRSATVRADEELVCYALTWEAYETLRREHEAVAIAFLANLGRELAARLRRANRTIAQLES